MRSMLAVFVVDLFGPIIGQSAWVNQTQKTTMTSANVMKHTLQRKMQIVHSATGFLGPSTLCRLSFQIVPMLI